MSSATDASPIARSERNGKGALVISESSSFSENQKVRIAPSRPRPPGSGENQLGGDRHQRSGQSQVDFANGALPAWIEAQDRRRSPQHAVSRYDLCRRPFEALFALIALVVSAPLMALIAVVVVVTMGRPILFRQERPGLHGRNFTLVKFRTMRNGGGSDAERLTKTGSLLRASSFDELPQLLNIARGEMSFVGPRPLLPEYVSLYNERQARRHEVRPGITGLAQVCGRNSVTWEERLETDVIYVQNRSLRLDLWIMSKTAIRVVRRADVVPEGAVTMNHFTGSHGTVERAA